MTRHHDLSLQDTNLAARRLGGMVLEATDEFFAPKENLLVERDPAFDPSSYADRGKVMDGWETRRRRDGGTDHCLIRLGVPGVVTRLVVDTTHFRGNAPEGCWLEGCLTEADVPSPDSEWFPLLKRSPVEPNTSQHYDVATSLRVSHVRFGIVPDGGVARVRVLGRPIVDLNRATFASGYLDLAGLAHGGRIVACSDAFFGSPSNMLMVGDARDMSDGWETRRRRGDGHDWAVVQLATTGAIDRVEIDTTHFKGNHPAACSIEVAKSPGVELPPDTAWVPVRLPTPMRPHYRHILAVDPHEGTSHLRINLLTDGGISRLRAFGTIGEDGWQRHGLVRLNSAPESGLIEGLLACCGSPRWARGIVDGRPFGTIDDLFAVADEVWASCDRDDRLEAFAAHRQVGEPDAGWSNQEPTNTPSANAAVLESLAIGSQKYQERFGHVFLIRAQGHSAEELLAILEDRLGNDPETELAIASRQQAEITRCRLRRLLTKGVVELPDHERTNERFYVRVHHALDTA